MNLSPFSGNVRCSPSYYTNVTKQPLVDQSGETFDVSSFPGKISLLNFVFTQCSGTCPLQTANLKQLYDSLSDDVKEHTRFVSVSIDPGRDTPAALQDFVYRFDPVPRIWLSGADDNNVRNL